MYVGPEERTSQFRLIIENRITCKMSSIDGSHGDGDAIRNLIFFNV